MLFAFHMAVTPLLCPFPSSPEYSYHLHVTALKYAKPQFLSPLIQSVEEFPALQATQSAERQPGALESVLVFNFVTIDLESARL